MPEQPSTTTTVFLVRHGETVWHAENRYAGADSDVDLTDRGRDQALGLARWAAGAALDHLVVSPVRRARETAAPVAAATGLPAHVEHDLREVGFGEAEGRSATELEHHDPEALARFRADPAAHPFPGAEPPAGAAARGAACLHRIAAEHPGERVLVVAHNTVLRLALCDLLGLPVGEYRRTFPRLDNAALCEVRIDPATRSTALVRLNAPPQPPAPSADLPTAPSDRTTTLEETP